MRYYSHQVLFQMRTKKVKHGGARVEAGIQRAYNMAVAIFHEQIYSLYMSTI